MVARGASRSALIFILITVLINVIGLGIILPVLPQLIGEVTGAGIAGAAVYGGWLMFVYGLMQFLFAPVMGSLSDQYGRRPILLLSLLALGIDYLFMAVAPTIGLLFAGRLIAGIAGATVTTANAYIADVTPPEKRAQNFGLIGAAFGLGFVAGPVVGGILGEIGTRIPFYAAAGLAFANLLFGFIVLPETLSAENRRPFSWARANTFTALSRIRTFPLLAGLIGVIILYQLAHDANPAAWAYFTMLKFGWSEQQVGYSLGAVGLAIAIVQGGLIRVIIPRIGEVRAVCAGLISGAIGFAGFAFAPDGTLFYASILLFALIGLAMPALRSLMSNAVPDSAQGHLQGVITSVQSLTAILSPLLMTQLFFLFSRPDAAVQFPGAPFLAAALCLLAGLALFLRAVPAVARAQSPA